MCLSLWCNNNPSERKLIKNFQTDNFNILKNLALYIKKAKYIREEILSLLKGYSSYFVYQWYDIVEKIFACTVYIVTLY